MKYSLTQLPLTPRYQTLGETFSSSVQPTAFHSECELLHLNYTLAEQLCVDTQDHTTVTEHLSGKRIPNNSNPFAMLYAGHQFGQWVPQLGDGRAITIAETLDKHNQPVEIQLKGSGLTPYSRDGDGRAVLRSTLREYLCSEAMHALGIPSTRALALVCSDDEVYREQIERGAILTRVAPSHIRFGHFEVFYYRNQYEPIKTLADFVITHYYPDLLNNETDPYIELFRQVVQRTAQLIAQWQAVGFCHGVMNSDNMSILGLTIDYGPFGFLDAYDPTHICNHSDYHGRYAYNQQADIGLFNLSCLAQSLLPLFDAKVEQSVALAKQALNDYSTQFLQAYHALMRAKLGLNQQQDDDLQLISDLLQCMAQDRVDYTILFRRMCTFNSAPEALNEHIRDCFLQRDFFDHWAQRYKQRLHHEGSDDSQRKEAMMRVNPKYILRNYMAETAIRQAEEQRDYSEIERLFKLLQQPYDEQPENERYAAYPPDWATRLSVSCSS